MLKEWISVKFSYFDVFSKKIVGFLLHSNVEHGSGTLAVLVEEKTRLNRSTFPLRKRLLG